MHTIRKKKRKIKFWNTRHLKTSFVFGLGGGLEPNKKKKL